MKILIVDRDEIPSQLIKSKLEPIGHKIFEETSKDKVAERAASEQFDFICIDPSPLTDASSVVVNVRRSVGHYPYIVLMSDNINREEAIKASANDALSKPLDPGALEEKINNADRLTKLLRRISDDSEDFPSAGGVIAKSAFNQLFLSGMDRADRYGERTFVLFISMSNYQEILAMDGAYTADYAVAKLSQFLVRSRRQSDIIGQTAKNEYALLLQRPIYETEPMEAAARFAEAITNNNDVTASEGATPIEITVSLIDLPVGSELVSHVIGGVEQQQEAV